MPGFEVVMWQLHAFPVYEVDEISSQLRQVECFQGLEVEIAGCIERRLLTIHKIAV